MKLYSTLLIAFLFLPFFLTAENKDVITQWTFDGTIEPALGTGNIKLIGGTLEHSIDIDNGWRFDNFPKQGAASGTAGAEIMVSTAGFTDVVLEFEHRSSGTASRWAQFQYTTDGGDTWQVYGNNDGGLNPRDIFHSFVLDFSNIDGVDDNPGFGVRIVSVFSPLPFNPGEPDLDFPADIAYHRARDFNDGGSAYAPLGNWRLRDVRLLGVRMAGEFPHIAQWSFDGTTIADYGPGSAGLLGGTQEYSVDMNDGWRFDNFPTQAAEPGTAGAQVMVSTAGYENVQIYFNHRASGTASRWAQFEYTTDGGNSWDVYGNNDGGLNPRDIFHSFVLDFSNIDEVDDNPDFGVRIVSIFSPEPFNPGVPDLDFLGDVAYHRARDWYDGGSAYDPSGNWRLRNVLVSGDLVLEPDPVELRITSVNGGGGVFTHVPLRVFVHSYNSQGQPAVVAADTDVELSLVSGDGTLSGTLTGTINQGSNFVVLTDVVYDIVEDGVVLKADSDNLLAGQSTPFNVGSTVFNLEVGYNMEGAGAVTGGGEFAPGETLTVSAAALHGFVFDYWIDFHQNIVSDEAVYTFDMMPYNYSLKAVFSIKSEPDLVHYWHFNNLPDGSLDEVPSDFSAFESGVITYPGTGVGYMDSYGTGSGMNLHQEADEGLALRVRNPAITRELIIEAPSAGFEDLVLTYEVHRSGNGPTEQDLSYSTDGGNSWKDLARGVEITEEYAVLSFPMEMYTEINNEADLMFRIMFTGENNDWDQGNHRFDNVSLTGNLIEGYTNIEDQDINHSGVKVYPNPARNQVTVDVGNASNKVVLYSVTGSVVYEKSFVGVNSVNINLSEVVPGVYFVKVFSVDSQLISTAKLVVK